MDFRFTEEEERFRQEVRDFLAKELPPDWDKIGIYIGSERAETEEEWAFCCSLARKLGGRGWLALGWPKEYGGLGGSHIQQCILSEEMAYRAAPGVDVFGCKMLGPTLIVHGTEEQKRRHLPPIAKGEIVWCQGFTEPGAGSDLASLQCRAIEQEDHFVVNGQKVYTTGAHWADWIFFLVRTDPQAPKHRGISMLVADMKTPGIEVRPLVNLAGTHSFNEVFFEDVRVPKDNLVGEKNRGWYVAASLLDFERSGIEYPAACQRILERLVAYARESRAVGQPLSQDPGVRHKLAEMAVEIQVCRMLSYRIAWMQSRHLIPNYEASIGKVFGSEMVQRVNNTACELLGLYGQLVPGSKHALLGGLVPHEYMLGLGWTLAGGSSEVQRNIVATRGLGLPR